MGKKEENKIDGTERKKSTVTRNLLETIIKEEVFTDKPIFGGTTHTKIVRKFKFKDKEKQVLGVKYKLKSEKKIESEKPRKDICNGGNEGDLLIPEKRLVEENKVEGLGRVKLGIGLSGKEKTCHQSHLVDGGRGDTKKVID